MKAHKSVLKVMEGLPPGDIKDDFQKLLGALTLEMKKPEERGRSTF